MRGNKWYETLREFKEIERPETVLLISGNQSLIRIIVAWMNMSLERKKRLSKFEGDCDEIKWKWLCGNTNFSLDELARRLPGVDKELEQKINALIANRILYPDGSINGFVEKFLRDKIVRIFTASGNKSRKAG